MRPTVLAASLALGCALLGAPEAQAHSHSPSGAIGTVRPGSVGCSFTSCFAVIDFADVISLPPWGGRNWRTSMRLSLGPDGRYSAAGRMVDFETFVKSLAAGDRIAVISEVDTDGSGALFGGGLGVARLGRASQPSAELFPACGAPPWSKEAAEACSSAPRSVKLELSARVAIAPVSHPDLDKRARETVLVDQITLRSRGAEIAPPADTAFIDLTRKRLAKMTKARPTPKALVAGDRIKLDVEYERPEATECSSGCWPTVNAVGPITVSTD